MRDDDADDDDDDDTATTTMRICILADYTNLAQSGESAASRRKRATVGIAAESIIDVAEESNGDSSDVTTRATEFYDPLANADQGKGGNRARGRMVHGKTRRDEGKLYRTVPINIRQG